MNSAAAAGRLSNKDGHTWSDGARGHSARVTDAGPGKVKVSGFASNRGANGTFDFSRSSGTCTLESDHSRHRLSWSC